MKTKFELIDTGHHKVGLDEVNGLREALVEAFKPVLEALDAKLYWHDELGWDSLEYKSRDGFIPYSHNHGGLEIQLVIPKCEAGEFPYLEFGECDECDYSKEDGLCGYNGQECGSESENYLDAAFRLIVKFEGIEEDGSLNFYINLCGGNGDAPYFRVNHLADVYDAEFSSKSLAGIKRAASKHVKALVQLIKGKGKQ